jgi:hypothetical protein
VFHIHLLVLQAEGESLGGAEGVLNLLRESIEIHVRSLREWYQMSAKGASNMI